MRQCRHCGSIFDSLECPTCAKEHRRIGREAQPLYYPGGRKAISLTLDQIEGNSEEAQGGTLFPVKGFRR